MILVTCFKEKKTSVIWEDTKRTTSIKNDNKSNTFIKHTTFFFIHTSMVKRKTTQKAKQLTNKDWKTSAIKSKGNVVPNPLVSTLVLFVEWNNTAIRSNQWIYVRRLESIRYHLWHRHVVTVVYDNILWKNIDI